MKHLDAVAQAFGESGGALRDDHEFLEIDGRVGVGAAVEDVHHRDREDLGVGSAEVFEKREADLAGGGMRGGERDGEQRVGAELRFVGRAVEGDHCAVDGDLIEGIEAGEFLGDDLLDVRDGLGDALAQVAVLHAVAQLPGFVFARAGAAGHGGAADGAAGEFNIGFDSGIAPGIENLPGANIGNGGQ